MKRFLAIILVIALAASMLACAQPSSDTSSETAAETTQADTSTDTQQAATEATPVSGGTLDIAVAAEVNSLLWTGYKSPEDYIAGMLFYESLLKLDEDGVPQPYLCDSFTADPDNLTYTIVLKQGIKFQDGSELNAKACAWNLQMYKDTGRKSASFFSNIESFEVTDDYTVVIHMSEWDSTIPQSLARECGFMFSEQAWETYGEEYCSEHPVGTGPFILTEWNKDVDKTFVRFDDYWQGTPLLDEVVIHIYEDSLVAQAGLETGDIDAYYCVDYSLDAAMADKGYVVATGTIPTTMPFLLFNSVNPDDPLNNILVRQAISYAIDQQALCDAIYYGYVSPTNQFAPENSVYYSKDVVGYSYNPDKAKELLAEAGYADGFSTTLEAKNEATIVACVTAIQAQLAEVGIDVQLNIIDAADYGVALTGWDSGLFFHPTGLPTDIINQAASMWIQGLTGTVLGLTSVMRPDDLNETILAARSTATEEEAQQLMQEAQVMMIDDYCLFWPIGVGYNTWILSPSLHDSGINDIKYDLATLQTAWFED